MSTGIPKTARQIFVKKDPKTHQIIDEMVVQMIDPAPPTIICISIGTVVISSDSNPEPHQVTFYQQLRETDPRNARPRTNTFIMAAVMLGNYRYRTGYIHLKTVDHITQKINWTNEDCANFPNDPDATLKTVSTVTCFSTGSNTWIGEFSLYTKSTRKSNPKKKTPTINRP